MMRGVYIQRAPGERMTLESALTRHLREVTPTKRGSTRTSEYKKAQPLLKHLGKYSLAALSADIVAQYRDMRLVRQGYRVTSIFDYQQVQELAKINGDLGRLGGLLKLWLTDDAKLFPYDMTAMSKAIVGMLDEIRANQSTIRSVMTAIVTPLAAKNLAAKISHRETADDHQTRRDALTAKK